MSVTLDEDPVSFLARMRQACPKVLSILNSKQARLLSEDPSKPYDKENANEEYLTEISSYYGLNQKCREAGKDLRGALLKPTIQKKTVDVEDFEAMKEILKKIVERLKLVIESRLVATEEKLGEVYLPRIIRMCRKLKLSKNEIEIATYCLTAQCGYDHEGGRFSSYGVDCLSCCQFLDIPLKDMLEFLNKDRIHMQQGFFPEVQDAYILNSALMYDMDFCKTLMGCRVRSDGFMKLEQTVLADIIVEEPGNDHYRNEDDESPINKQPPKAVGSQDSDEVEEGKGDDPSITGESTEPLGVNLTIPGEIPEADIGELKPKEDHGELDLDMILRLERQKESITVKEEDEGDDINVDEDDPGKLKPYKTDLEYLDDHFKYIMLMIKIKSVDNRMEMEEQFDDEYRQTQRYQRQKREAMTKAKVQDKICKKRLALTKAWVPRLERMVQSRNLCEFEKNVLLTLIGSILQPTKFNNIDAHISNNHVMVGELLRIFCSGLEEQIQHRKYFYKSSSLVREGMIVVHSSGLTGDTSTASVEVDRRMLDFCVGLDTEFSEIVEGSHLYFPKTKFDNVILPKEQKQLILSTVSNFEAYKRCRKKMGLDDAITYGAGMVMLFHGVPGTGKTMMANALANKLNKKVLLINFPSLGTMTAGENFKFIFREAKINDAILFFDECEAIFESREMGGHQVNLLLTEIERHDGLIILATNRPYDLDEAMHRRIMIAIEFRQPDHLLRKAIWESHMPEQMKLADDIDLSELALRFELTGGFIKNAILSALSISVSRDGDSPIIHQKDLLQGANLQLRGRLRMKDFDRRVIPTAGLDEVIVEDSIAKQLKEIVQYEKARAVLFGQWGFAKRNHQGLTILLHGSPGTGKTLVAEAIGYEVGKPLKVVNCGELLSKWVGESSKNINSIFQEARHQDAILVFDEAEGLFGQRTETTTSTDRYANVDVGILLYHIERFPGIIILTTNLIDNIDKAFFRRLRFVLKFDIPKRNLRTKLWKVIIPEEAPLADDVDFERLAHYEMSGGNIKSTVFRAAARAALREEGNRKITMEDLEEASKDEIAKTSTRMGFRRQDSDAVNMYN